MNLLIALLLALLALFGGKPADLHTNTVSVASMNVCARHCPWLAPFSERVPEIAANLTANRPAVIALQEVGNLRVETASTDVAMAPYGYARVAGGYARYIYVRIDVEVVDTGIIKLDRPSDGRMFAFPWATVRVGGEDLTVVNIHLAPDDGVTGDRDRLVQSKQLAGLIPSGDVVMIGDCNCLSTRDAPESDVDSQRWRTHDYLMGSGWNAAVPDTNTFIGGGPVTEGVRLGVLPFDRAYLRGLSGSVSVIDTGDLSDHLGIALALEVER